MLVGVGVDITSVERIARLEEKHGERFTQKLFTANERLYSERFSDPQPHLAARFAAKEAAYKALGGRGPIHWKEIEVKNDERGQPHLEFHGETARLARMLGVVSAQLSLAHDVGMAIAYVVLEGNVE